MPNVAPMYIVYTSLIHDTCQDMFGRKVWMMHVHISEAWHYHMVGWLLMVIVLTWEVGRRVAHWQSRVKWAESDWPQFNTIIHGKPTWRAMLQPLAWFGGQILQSLGACDVDEEATRINHRTHQLHYQLCISTTWSSHICWMKHL